MLPEIPPVATTVTGVFSSASMRSIMPSIIAAVPKTAPDFMLSTVLVPMQRCGASIEMFGKRLVPDASAEYESLTPGTIAPPIYAPSRSMATTVVAVPMSTTISGGLYSAAAPTAPVMRSPASVPGSSILTFMPVFIPAPTTMQSSPVSFLTAVFMARLSCGTTEDSIAPSMLRKSMPSNSRLCRIFSA